MPTIHKLPDLLISKIAAGEVVERPAYAVKELIENAIDAQADYIRIDIEKSGTAKIVISDNGIGMPQEDIELSFLPHTTSKLKTEEDLHGIKSMGFRGEALSSIASISQMTIQSRTKDSAGGIQIEIQDGTILQIKPVGMPQGTTVIVENLFSPVPARKKFLRSSQTEFRHILDIVIDQALAHPTIRFFLTHNKKTLLDVPQHPDIHERIHTLLGTSMFSNLIPIFFEDSYVTIHGYISKPQMHSTTIKHYLFVNKRRITDTKISQTIRETYGTLLDPHTQPIVVLFFDIPPEMVDVNVHPRKEHIHFHNQEIVLKAIKTIISETLQTKNLTYQDKRWSKSDSFEDFLIRDGSTNTYAGKALKRDVSSFLIEDKKEIDVDVEIAQYHDLYLVTQTEKGILLIDQHAAHERILYEEFAESFKKRKEVIEKFKLKKVVIIDFPVNDAEIMRENLEKFNQLGFEIDEFKGNTFKVSTVPTFFHDRNIPELILEIVADISQDANVKNIDIRSHRMLTYLACRSAIKSGEKISQEERKELLKKLSKCKEQFTCPHGRPTQIEINLKDLGKMFKRT